MSPAMRIGVSLNEPPAGADVIGHLRDQITTAAADGFASGWMANIFGLEAITALVAAGQGVDGFELGTAVIPTYPRHPAMLAQQALTAQVALQGRFALGIGLSHQVVIESMYGYSFDKPARHMREYLSVLLPLIREGRASFEGETIQGRIGLSTPRDAHLPVLLAALAPRMLALAGGEADGTVLWMTGPDTVESHIVPKLTAAAEAAGRPAPRVVCTLPVCVTDDPDGARARAAEIFSMYGQLPSYRAMLDLEGAETPGDVAMVGDADAVRSQIRRLGEIGVTDYVAANFSGGDEGRATRDLLKELVA